MSDQINDDKFPGYPHYPAKEDIMDKRNSNEVDMDVEHISRQAKPDPNVLNADFADETMTGDKELTGQNTDGEPNDADITSEDLLALGETEQSYGLNIGKEGEQLDVPGSEDDDAAEEIGAEDEENNYYSLGGDAHENLDEDQG